MSKLDYNEGSLDLLVMKIAGYCELYRVTPNLQNTGEPSKSFFEVKQMIQQYVDDQTDIVTSQMNDTAGVIEEYLNMPCPSLRDRLETTMIRLRGRANELKKNNMSEQNFYAVIDLRNDMDIFKFGKIKPEEIEKHVDLFASYGESEAYPFIGTMTQFNELLKDWDLDNELINKVRSSAEKLLLK